MKQRANNNAAHCTSLEWAAKIRLCTELPRRGLVSQVLRYIAAAFPLAAAKAEESLLKLKDLRDNNIFKSLAELATPTTSLEESAKLAKVLHRLARQPMACHSTCICCKTAPPVYRHC